MISRIAILALCLSIGSLTATADRATNKRSVNARKKDERENQQLAKSAEAYWRSVRWNDVEGASSFVERPDDRLMYQQHLDDEASRRKVIEARVLRIEVSPERRKNEITDGKVREAKVTVSVEGYTLPGQVLEKKMIQQQWYRSTAGWWIVWVAPELPQP
jgi:hypothetical protein